MEKMIKAFCVFILATLLLASCDMAEPMQPTNATEAPTKQEKPSVNETEAPTNEQESVIEVDPLILDDYDDYLLFRKGELDVNEAYYIWYGSNPNALIDIREKFDLPELPSDWKEKVLFQSDDGFGYSVYSINESGKSILEYDVIVTYNPDEKLLDFSNVPFFDSIKANTENEKRFNIRKNESILRYNQDNGVYRSLTIVFDKYKVSFGFLPFEERGYTPEQIEENCGKLVASFFSKNDDEFSRGVETVTKAIGALSRAESSFS